MRHWPTILPAVVGVALVAGMHCFQSSILADVPQRPTIADVSWQRKTPGEGSTALAGRTTPPGDDAPTPSQHQPQPPTEDHALPDEPYVPREPEAIAADATETDTPLPYDPIEPDAPRRASSVRVAEPQLAPVGEPATETADPQIARAMPSEPAGQPAVPRVSTASDAPPLPSVPMRKPTSVVAADDLEYDGSEKTALFDDAADLERYTSGIGESDIPVGRPVQVAVREQPSEPRAQSPLKAAAVGSQRRSAEPLSGATQAAPAAVRVDLPTVDVPEAIPAPIRQQEVLASVEAQRPRSEAVYARPQQGKTVRQPQPVAPMVVLATPRAEETSHAQTRPEATVVKPEPVKPAPAKAAAQRPDPKPLVNEVPRPAPPKPAVAEPDPDGHDRNMMLIMALQDPDKVVRKWAAEVLAGTQDERAVKPLIRLLDDGDWWVRRSAMYSLMQFDDPRAVMPIIDKLRKGHWKDRQVAALVLGKMKATKALGPLIEQLDGGNSRVRTACAVALGQLGDAKAVPALQRAMQDDQKSVRLAAKRALKRIRSGEVAARTED
ncbi:MAG: HEAT repeat domain-containing protein [Phycisphaerae bacterium]